MPAFALAPSMSLSPQPPPATSPAPPRPHAAASKLVSAALAIDPIRRLVMAAGRRKIIKDANRIGVPWDEDVVALEAILVNTLEPLRAAVASNVFVVPEYYKAPFHAYPDGNLGWMPAFEAEVSSQAVHTKLSESGDPLEGDAYLRNNAADIFCERWSATGNPPPTAVLDIGCSIGLSSGTLKARWPDAAVVGLDPSAEMLAVAMHRRPNVRYVHGVGEAIPPAAHVQGGFHVVTVQLVLHEMPDKPARALIADAMRLLKPGGMLAVMDVDPAALRNTHPALVALFQSTEPFYEHFASRDIAVDMASAGFVDVKFGKNTSRHRTYTAFKPLHA